MPMSEYVRRVRYKVGNELLHVPAVSVLLHDKDGRVLLVRTAEDGLWTTPGGMIEPGETPADAAVREMWEETSILVELTSLLGVFGGPIFAGTYSNGDRVSWIGVVFGARAVGGTLAPDGDETLELRYVADDELAELECQPHTLEVLQFARGSRVPYFAPAQWSPIGA